MEVPKAIQLCCDHTVPFVLIMIDFCMNVVPFTWRHFIIQYSVYTSYMIFNMICTKIRGQPIYPPLDWFSERSLITFGIQAVAGVVVFWLVKKGVDAKLARNGFKTILECERNPKKTIHTLNSNYTLSTTNEKKSGVVSDDETIRSSEKIVTTGA